MIAISVKSESDKVILKFLPTLKFNNGMYFNFMNIGIRSHYENKGLIELPLYSTNVYIIFYLKKTSQQILNKIKTFSPKFKNIKTT